MIRVRRAVDGVVIEMQTHQARQMIAAGMGEAVSEGVLDPPARQAPPKMADERFMLVRSSFTGEEMTMKREQAQRAIASGTATAVESEPPIQQQARPEKATKKKAGARRR